MCRLAFIPSGSSVSRASLLRLFEYLESACGGDGNGFVCVKADGSEYRWLKSLDLSSAQIVAEVFKLIRSGWHCYYHTRKVSVGWLSDAQCHPHEVSGAAFDGFLCHNGTWGDGAPLARYLGKGSDTAALAHLLGKWSIDELEKRRLFPTSGVFLLTGTPAGDESVGHRVLKLSGDLYYCPVSRIWASDFPFEWDADREPAKQVWEVANGRHCLLKPAPVAPVKVWSTATKSGSVCEFERWPMGYNQGPKWSTSYPAVPSKAASKAVASGEVSRGIVFE